MSHPRCLIALAVCALGLGPAAYAQPPAERPDETPAERPADAERALPDAVGEAAPDAPRATRPVVDPPVEEDATLSYDEAIAQGYDPRPPEDVNGSLTASLLALGPGLAVHGIGHLYLDETRTGVLLLLTELTALLLIVGGAAADIVTEGSGSVATATDALTHTGVVLFLGSWLADIVGSFTGTVPFDPDSTRVEGSVFGVAYRYTDSPLDAFRHHLVARLSIDLGWLYIRPLIDVEASLGAREGELDVGTRLVRGDDPHEHLAVGLVARRRENEPDGFAVSGVMGYAWAKADLGRFMRTLRHVYIAGRLGYGTDGYQFTRAGAAPSFFADVEFTDTRLLLQSGLGFNTGENTHMLLLWSQDTVGDTPPDPELGLFELGLQHRYLDTLDIEVELTLGDGFAVWLGLGYAL